MSIHQFTINTSQKAAPLARLLRELRGAVGGVIAVVGILWATPAAAVPGLTSAVSPATATDSIATKTISVSCPAGTKIYQGGGDITIVTGAGSGKVILHQVFPTPNLDSVTVMAVETGVSGFSGTWNLRARAICGSPVANMVRVKKTGVSSVSNSKTTDASCPANTVAYGTGFALQGGGAGVVFADGSDLQPAGGAGSGTAVGSRVRATVDTAGFPVPWSIDALVICGSKAPGYELISAQTPFDATNPKSLSMACSGVKKVHGHGWGLTTDNGNLVAEKWFHSSAALTTYRIHAAQNVPNGGSWPIQGRMICAN
jgi:hypothetical protein